MTLHEFIQELQTDGFSDKQIADFLEDGAALAELAKKIDFTQDDVEQAYQFFKSEHCDKFRVDQYGTVYELDDNSYHAIGKLNGLTLPEFLQEYREEE